MVAVMMRVILESPYGSDDPEIVAANVDYARQCVRDSVLRGEAPIASHLLFTQPGILDDLVPEERHLGIAAGLAWLNYADAMVLYIDRGMSGGMREAMKAAQLIGVPTELRVLETIELEAPKEGLKT
jgi:hypothetical protein